MADRRLQVFHTVAKQLSFTKAAELLFMHFDGDYDLDEEEIVDVAFLESLLEIEEENLT